MKLFYDFHIHSCLSPCASDDMTPNNICNMAKLAGYDVIAVSDHNSCLNSPAVMKAAADSGILAIPAMELTTAEEVHVLCLLPNLESALSFSEYVRLKLPNVRNRPEIFGEQLVMNEYDEVSGQEDRLLTSASTIGLYETASLLKSFGGIAIPAHIDRPSFSLLSNLGFYDKSMGFSVYEVSRNFGGLNTLLLSQPYLKSLGVIRNSDAHDLSLIPDAQHTIETDSLDALSVIDSLNKLPNKNQQ
jgi:3',5'-nucleoside bisphosphate phosphatase